MIVTNFLLARMQNVINNPMVAEPIKAVMDDALEEIKRLRMMIRRKDAEFRDD